MSHNYNVVLGRPVPRRFLNADRSSARSSFPIGSEVLPGFSLAALRNLTSRSDTVDCVGSDSVSGKRVSQDLTA